jgi:HEAT repeat protein
MPTTDDEMIALLRADEPNFTAIAELVPDALPVLRRLVETGDAEVATKSAGLAGKLEGPERADVLLTAMEHNLPTVRMAAARATANLPVDEAQPLLARALRDHDAGVRAVAVRALPADAAQELVDEVRSALANEPDEAVQELMRNAAAPER